MPHRHAVSSAAKNKEVIMKLFKRILIALVIVIILAAAGGYLYVRHLATKAIPDYNQNVKLRRIKQEVTVYRDAFAVPHVYAENEQDLYRAVGYVMAQDRLWQMDLLRRVTTGRLSEIFGQDLVETDLLMRALRIPEKSELILAKSDKKLINALEAFADGVNQFIEKNKNRLPPEFSVLRYEPEKWEIIHSVNLVGYMAWDLTMSWGGEILLHKISKKVDAERFKEMIPNLALHKTPVIPDFSLESTKIRRGLFKNKRLLFPNVLANDYNAHQWDGLLKGTEKLAELGLGVFDGSNNWVVSGKKSVTGKPIFANDMHLGLFAPGIWYQMHQVVENDSPLNVTGVVVPGQPFIVCGHNDSIAWGMTNVMLDDMDFYRETVNPDNPHQYKFNGKWHDMEVRKETIKTREGDTVTKELRFTHRGPVISGLREIKKEAVSMRWIGNEYSNEVRTIFLLNRAKNWQDFREAVKTFIAISQNIAYADIHGNIGLQVSAGIPIRKNSYHGFPAVPGETDEYDWKGIVPFEELPYSFNPESGHVSSANNKSVGNDYPYYISHWFALSNRIDRIREMLEAKEKLSIEDIKKMHGDFKSKHAETYLGEIIEIMQQTGDLNALEKQVLQLLAGWDRVFTTKSAAAAIFDNLYLIMIKNLVKDELGEELYREYLGNKIMIENLVLNTWKNRNSAWYDDIDTEPRETFTLWIQKSFKETVRKLQSKWGDNPVDWQWGKMHKLLLRHPIGSIKLLDKLFNLNRGPYEVGGSFNTVCPFSYSFRNPFICNYGASHRHVYSTADWDQSQSVIPTGTSGIPASPYYCDQTEGYLKNEYHNDFFSKEQVTENAKYTMIISKN